MSYSRWINSTWYSFWGTSDAKRKEDEVFCLWADMSQTKDWLYGELKTWTVETVLENYDGITQKQAEEAMQYIKQFLNDVDDEYNGNQTPTSI